MAAFKMEELQLEIWPRAETTAAETAANVQQQQNWANLQHSLQQLTAEMNMATCVMQQQTLLLVELLLTVWEKRLVNDQWSYSAVQSMAEVVQKQENWANIENQAELQQQGCSRLFSNL